MTRFGSRAAIEIGGSTFVTPLFVMSIQGTLALGF
jgi:hypothetical protein